MAKATLSLGELLRLLADNAAWKHDDDACAADEAITALYGERPEPDPEPLPPGEAAQFETDRRIAEMQRQLEELRNPGTYRPTDRTTDAERQLDDPRWNQLAANSTDRRLTDAERQLDDPRSIAEAERQLAEAQRRLDEVRNRRGDVRNSDELRGSDEVRHAGFDQFGSSAVVTGPSV